MYILPKAHILKLPKIFYENLQVFVSYTLFPAEAFIVERALYTVWASSFEVNDTMLKPINPEMTTILPSTSIERFKEKIPVSVRKMIPASAKQTVITLLKKWKKL
jgi:hypothetical protein